MKKLLVIFILICSSTGSIYSQNKTIEGKVVSEFFETLPGVSIMINDTVEVGKTDLDGSFKIVIPDSEKKILFKSLGLEPTTIEIVDKCSKIEIVMMLNCTYDFISLKRAERKRWKRYRRLPEIHEQAFEKGLFETKYACYNREFEVHHPR